jgi:uncharacterized membrane protein
MLCLLFQVFGVGPGIYGTMQKTLALVLERLGMETEMLAVLLKRLGMLVGMLCMVLGRFVLVMESVGLVLVQFVLILEKGDKLRCPESVLILSSAFLKYKK